MPVRVIIPGVPQIRSHRTLPGRYIQHCRDSGHHHPQGPRKPLYGRPPVLSASLLSGALEGPLFSRVCGNWATASAGDRAGVPVTAAP